MRPVDVSVLERCAKIFGPSSASSKALTDYRNRAESGESVGVFMSQEHWIIGPAPADPEDGEPNADTG